MKLKNELSNVMKIFKIESNGSFNHADFMWSTNVSEVINDPIMGILMEADNKAWSHSNRNLVDQHKPVISEDDNDGDDINAIYN